MACDRAIQIAFLHVLGILFGVLPVTGTTVWIHLHDE